MNDIDEPRFTAPEPFRSNLLSELREVLDQVDDPTTATPPDLFVVKPIEVPREPRRTTPWLALAAAAAVVALVGFAALVSTDEDPTEIAVGSDDLCDTFIVDLPAVDPLSLGGDREGLVLVAERLDDLLGAAASDQRFDRDVLRELEIVRGTAREALLDLDRGDVEGARSAAAELVNRLVDIELLRIEISDDGFICA